MRDLSHCRSTAELWFGADDSDMLPAMHIWKLVFEDADLLVVSKPSGLLSVPGRGLEGAINLSAQVQDHYPGALVVHRLDMSTSGLMMFARHAYAQRALQRAFESRTVAKRYIAVVQGWPADDAGSCNAPMRLDWPARPRQVVDWETGKPSYTRWHVLQRLGSGHGAQSRRARMSLEPVTGRSHQLRVHMQALGHPIIGDELYGSAPGPGERLLLHATNLSLQHPVHGTPLQFESLPPF